MQEEITYLIEAKLLGVSIKEIKSAMALKCLLDEEVADDPLQMKRHRLK